MQNQFFADLHMHSRFSRATSPRMNIEELAAHAKIKGLHILGTGDFTHPLWLNELKKLEWQDGIYDYDGIKFIPSGEISLIYTQGRGRRVHIVMLAENLDIVSQINEFLAKRGRLDYDGRPIFNISCIELADELMRISKDIMLIPAHCWTPWFSLFGSMSGFDSVKECFGDMAKHVHALETGLSSNPEMNWRLSQLDDYSLVSFSDSHSLPRIGREFCAFDLKKISCKEIFNAIKTRKGFAFTAEVPPAFGKYHYDGHRNCNVCMSPKESIKHNDICPSCKRKLTIGVEHRVEELADREDGFVPEGAVPFKSLIPLDEIIATVLGTNAYSVKAKNMYNLFIGNFGSETSVLLNAGHSELKKINEKLADAIIMNRQGKIKVKPGYDGVYGVPLLESTPQKKHQSLRDYA